jgi:hypothetical protein
MSRIPVMYLKSEARKLLEHHKFQTQLMHGWCKINSNTFCF